MKLNKIKKNSISKKIWLYFIIFSVLILAFLWLFQVTFLGTYYKWVKTNEIKKVVNKIEDEYKEDDFLDKLDQLTFNTGMCIEIADATTHLTYSTDSMDRGCLIGPRMDFYKNDFINSNTSSKQYELKNPRFDNKTLIYATKLDNNTYAFINTSLEAVDSTANILTSQLLYVTGLVLILSFVIAFFLSKKISKPIEKINNSAKKLADGDYDIIFTIDEDIDELNELTSTLNYARDELSKTNELRKDLMANVSHDLKTPLTMIKAYAEMVRDLTYKDKNKREKNLNVIIEETDRLNNLVNDILDLSVIESNSLKLNEEEFNLTILIKNILKRYEIFKEKEKYEFIFNYDNEINIYADEHKIEQVIYNLINNAINYTGDDKKIYINQIENNKEIKIEIKDTGIGIDKKDIPFIWDKYYKSDKKHKRNAIGTGLGLSIVKNILKLHNYKYGVKSEKNKGTTFYFIINKKENE